MKRSHAIALVLLAAAGLLGFTLLLQRALDKPEGFDATTDAKLVVLFVATTAVLVILGFFLGTIHFRSSGRTSKDRATLARLREALDLERGKRNEVSAERLALSQKVTSLEDSIKQLRHEQGENERLRQECGSLRDELAQAQDRAQEAVAEVRETKSGVAEQASAQEEFHRLANECDRLRDELQSRRERMVDLQAELSVARTEVEQARAEAAEVRELRSDAAKPLARLEGQSLRGVLESVATLEGVTVVVVADGEGLVVDAAGETLQADALAAVSGLVAELSPRFIDLLPLGEVSQVALGDVRGQILEVRYFPLFGESCALAIIRDETHPHPEIARSAIEAIVSRLAD